MNTLKRKEKQHGQALLFVVVAVTIALSVGVSVSTRTLSSQRRVASTDTATRVANAAEGGAETMLGKTYSFLKSFTPPGLPDCASVGFSSTPDGTKCVITYPPSLVSGDKITAKATVSAKPFSMNTPDNYWFDLGLGMVKEIKLDGYKPTYVIHVCWKNKKTAIYALSYDSSGKIKKEWFRSDGAPSSLTDNTSGFTSVNDALRPGLGYAGCAQITLVNSLSLYGLRIRALYEPSRVYVYPDSNHAFPDQGYKITSVGELVSGGDSDAKETRVVVVYKSYPYAASLIDSGLYSATGGIN